MREENCYPTSRPKVIKCVYRGFLGSADTTHSFDVNYLAFGKKAGAAIGLSGRGVPNF